MGVTLLILTTYTFLILALPQLVIITIYTYLQVLHVYAILEK